MSGECHRHRRGPHDHTDQHDRPSAPGPIHDPSGHGPRTSVEDRLQPEQQADLKTRQAERLPGEDGDEGAEGAPDQGHADQADRHRHESDLAGQGFQRFPQREPLSCVLPRLAHCERARNGEDQQHGRDPDVGAQVDPLQRETGDGGAEREADLH